MQARRRPLFVYLQEFLGKKYNNRFRAGETALSLSFVINERFELGRWLSEREVPVSRSG